MHSPVASASAIMDLIMEKSQCIMYCLYFHLRGALGPNLKLTFTHREGLHLGGQCAGDITKMPVVRYYFGGVESVSGGQEFKFSPAMFWDLLAIDPNHYCVFVIWIIRF